MSLHSTFSTAWKVGVARGDCFTYEMLALYSSSNSKAELEVPGFEFNNTDWVRIQITEVKGTLIFHIYTLQFKDGTQREIAGQTDVAVNSWSQSGVSFRGVPILPAELAAGDSVPSLAFAVSETLHLAYVGESRQTNQLDWNSTFDSGSCSFDRQTGMLVELRRNHLYVNPITGEVVTKTDIVRLKETNAWSTASEFSVATIFLFGATTSGFSSALLLVGKMG